VPLLSLESVHLPGVRGSAGRGAEFLAARAGAGELHPAVRRLAHLERPEFSRKVGQRAGSGMTWPKRIRRARTVRARALRGDRGILAAGARWPRTWFADKPPPESAPCLLRYGTAAAEGRGFFRQMHRGRVLFCHSARATGTRSDLASVRDPSRSAAESG